MLRKSALSIPPNSLSQVWHPLHCILLSLNYLLAYPGMICKRLSTLLTFLLRFRWLIRLPDLSSITGSPPLLCAVGIYPQPPLEKRSEEEVITDRTTFSPMNWPKWNRPLLELLDFPDWILNEKLWKKPSYPLFFPSIWGPTTSLKEASESHCLFFLEKKCFLRSRRILYSSRNRNRNWSGTLELLFTRNRLTREKSM